MDVAAEDGRNIEVRSRVCTGEYKETVKMGAGLADKLLSLTF